MPQPPDFGASLRDRWLPTPRPLAVFHRHRGGLPAEGYVLTEMVPDPAPLRPAGRDLTGRLGRRLPNGRLQVTFVPTRSPTERDGFTSVSPLMLEKLNRGSPQANELSDTP